MFIPDQPINSPDNDELGRNSFAKSFGEAILSYNDKDSIVIGLLGPWGCGKTSILNLAINHISKVSGEDGSQPIIFSFNPWNFSDQNQLISQFFKQLSLMLDRPDGGKTKIIGDCLKTYAKIFEPLALIPGIGTVASMMGKTMEGVGNAINSYGELKTGNLESIRDEIDDLMQSLDSKIIIIIDDIDRLNKTEIKQIFQLIKVIGNFPNTVYILAFDKNIVIKGLEHEQTDKGEEYLEKIIQIPFEVPELSRDDIERLLFAFLNKILKEMEEENFDSTYWGNIYYSGFKFLFNNVRDVIRYINVLRFTHSILKFDVNVIDLFALIGIEVFMPKVYYSIRANRDLFTNVYPFRTNDTKKEQDKKACDEIIAQQNVIQADVLLDLLKTMFPKVNSIYSNTHYSLNWLGEWRKESRICSPDHFEKFFKLSILNSDISQNEMKKIIKNANMVEAFEDSINKLINEKRIIRFLELMEDYTKYQTKEEIIENIIRVLINKGDLFPENKSPSITSIDKDMHILRVCHQLILRVENKKRRSEVLLSALKDATESIYTVVNEVAVQDQEHGKYGLKENPEPEDDRVLLPDDLEELEHIALDKIEGWAKKDLLIEHKKFIAILFMWKRWSDSSSTYQKYLESIVNQDDRLIQFLTGFITTSTSQGKNDYVSKEHQKFNLDGLKFLTDLDAIEARIRELVNDPLIEELDSKKKLAVTLFLEAIDGN